jgi:heat shock protein HtpX
MAVDFRSMLGFLGNLFAGWKRVPKHLGWFRRSMGGYLILRELKTTAGSLRAKPFFWQVVLCLIVIVGTFFLI